MSDRLAAIERRLTLLIWIAGGQLVLSLITLWLAFRVAEALGAVR